MSRNSSGNYTLPTGNPVVPGTTISTVWANATLGDLSAEMTDSLNRSGKGAMLAPLKATDGTVAAPSLTFANDPDTGVYRVSDNVVAMGANATQVQRWTTTGTTITGAAAVSGAATVGGGAVVTNATSNGNGISVTANGTGIGLDGTGGATSGYGVRGNGGAPNGQGVVGMGTGAGYGVEGVGGTTGGGGIFTPGTAASATVRTNAVVAYTGDIAFSTVMNPNSNVALANTLTPMNVPKAWATILTTGFGSTAATIVTGFNVTSASVATTTVTLTLATAMANSNFAVNVTAANPATVGSGTSGSTTTVLISCRDLDGIVMPSPTTTGTPIAVPLVNFQAGIPRTLYVFVFGPQ